MTAREAGVTRVVWGNLLPTMSVSKSTNERVCMSPRRPQLSSVQAAVLTEKLRSFPVDLIIGRYSHPQEPLPLVPWRLST